MAEQPKTGSRADAPYEGALNIALNKLTSEVLLFLLAYTILLIGVAVFGSGLPTELRTLLYIIPILGVVAYVWLQKRRIVRRATAGNVRVGSTIARRGAQVIGELGTGQGQGNTDVGSLFASDSLVAGRLHGEVAHQVFGNGEKSNDEMNYLMGLFRQLSKQDQRKLIASAQVMLDKQESSDD